MIEQGGPSHTARRVAAHRMDFERIAAPYGDPAADDAIANAVAGGLEVRHGRMHEYLAARTLFFDDFVVRGIERGVRQIVVGAAGYDGRAWRYAAPDTRWFEVDHPATQRDKVATLRRLGLDTSQVTFVAADFTAAAGGAVGAGNGQSLAGLLTAAGLDPAAPALFLFEGVAVYLTPDVTESVLGQFRDVAAPDSRLAISMPLNGTERAGPRFRDAVAAMGEPALSRFDLDEAEALLARAGWHSAPASAPAKAERARHVGLLTAQAGPRVATRPAAASAASAVPRALSPESEPAGPPLIALLSHALVAFVIEADNEAEHRTPHRTTDQGAAALGSGPWLTSLAMYENCLRYLGDGEPRTLGELADLARTGTNVDGMRRWGYLTIDGPVRSAAGRLRKHGPGTVVRATAAGRRASEVWAPLPAVVESRWRERFGDETVRELRHALETIVRLLDPSLPDTLPIAAQAMFARRPDPLPPPSARPVPDLPLNALLSRVLLAAALEFERDAALSLPVAMNLVRVLTAGESPLRDLPRLTGVSKEGIAMALSVLERDGLAVTGKVAGGRGQAVRLTEEGLTAQRFHHDHLASCEDHLARLDQAAVAALAGTLRPLPLTAGIGPYPDGWRAALPPPPTLPWYPMVLHRGGYPDGS